MKTKPFDEMTNCIEITIKNKVGKEFGNEVLRIDFENKNLHGLNMFVSNEYQNRGYRFGEILRLNSIITFLENGLKSFTTCSKNTAAIFHRKYKFKTSKLDNTEAKILLEHIAQCKLKDFSNLCSEARKALEKQDYAQANIIVDNFLDNIIEHNLDYKKFPLPISINMKLSSAEIKQNSEFFNKLLKKHNLNYQI